jgi:hypothetical protein
MIVEVREMNPMRTLTINYTLKGGEYIWLLYVNSVMAIMIVGFIEENRLVIAVTEEEKFYGTPIENMRLNNSTQFSTDDLRKFISVCAKQMEVSYILRRMRVVIKRKKKSYWRSEETDDYPSGCASLSGRYMKIRLPPVLNKRRLAFVVQHELYHTIGRGHRAIAREFGDWEISNSDKFAFADNLLLGEKVLNTKPPRNLKEERHKKAISKVAEFERKLKLTKTLLKKWQRKVKYYQK